MDSDESGSYEIRSTSRRTAAVEPIEITLRENADGSAKRLVLKVTLVTNQAIPEATLQATFAYQHRPRTHGSWSEDNFNLATLRAGQEVRMELHSAETLKLYRELERLYAASAVGVRSGRYAVTVTDADASVAVVPAEVAEQIQDLLETEGPGVFEVMAKLRPDLLAGAALVEEHRRRAADLAEFEEHLDDPADELWAERDWQAFFRRAPWIFGHGLDYVFLVNEEAEVELGGADFGGSGGQRGDELMRTAGQFRFAVLVELKKPTTALISGTAPYRNGAWRVGQEVAGGVSQLQANCERVRVAANDRSNVDWLNEREMTVADPQGILVVGHTGQLVDNARRASFHRFRRNLWNPTVLTYDELLERARFLVDKAATRAAASPAPAMESAPLDIDELPF